MSKRIIDCKVTNEYLKVTDVFAGASGSHDDVVLRLAFGDMWDGLTKTVQWLDARGLEPTIVILTPLMLEPGTTNVYLVPIPAEAKAYPGKMACTIKGVTVDGDTETSATLSVFAEFDVKPSLWDEDAQEAGDVTPTQAEQMQAEIDEILETISDAVEAKQAAIEAKQAAIDAKGTAQSAANTAAQAKDNASASATLSESWAVGGTGTRAGENTNNAKYWSEQAAHAAGGGVVSFNNRSGVVVPAFGDYTAVMVGAAPSFHEHSASDVTSGALPVARGGTGGGTAAAARTGIGAYFYDAVEHANEDMDNYTSPGMYRVAYSPGVNQTPLHTPFGGKISGYSDVSCYALTVMGIEGRTAQIAVSIFSMNGGMWWRTKHDNTFSAWHDFYSELSAPDEVRRAIGAQGNKNLLDNWDFTNPVNRRGATTYPGVGPNIDRWAQAATQTTGTAVLVQPGFVRVTSGLSYPAYMRQNVPNYTKYAGLPLTFTVDFKTIYGGAVSIVIGDGVGETTQGVIAAGIISVNRTIADVPTALYVDIRVDAAGGAQSVDIYRAKLEIGSVSTLANDPPADVAMEALKCAAVDNDGVYDAIMQVVSGSYIGTGTYGAENPTILSLPGAPKLVIVSDNNGLRPGDGLWSGGFMWEQGTTVLTGNSLWFSTGGQSLSWYNTMGAGGQQNTSGKTYYYTAILH